MAEEGREGSRRVREGKSRGVWSEGVMEGETSERRVGQLDGAREAISLRNLLGEWPNEGQRRRSGEVCDHVP